MNQPFAFEHKSKTDFVCQYKTSWNEKFLNFLIQLTNIIYLALRVDDGLVMATSEEVGTHLITHLLQEFKIPLSDKKQPQLNQKAGVHLQSPSNLGPPKMLASPLKYLQALLKCLQAFSKGLCKKLKLSKGLASPLKRLQAYSKRTFSYKMLCN